MLAPIPKVVDPKIDELRPLMLFEVLRKIWTGMIMGKMRDYWNKYGLIDENQHGFMGGKGTHTAIPIVLNCMEAAKDFATDLYMSSWDIKRAFDSLGPEYVIRALQRLHIPRDIAEYLVKMDDAGEVYVRTPMNIKLNMEGKLHEGRGFKRGKGVGQGDVPSPMLWVAAFDSLLTTLGKVSSAFKTQDIEGRTRLVRDVAFADDLISVAGTLEGLQRKADIMSAWCGISGVEIHITKLRTFGKEWGVKKGEGMKQMRIIMKDKVKKMVEVKDDGLMTHLGVIWNIDMQGKQQWNEIKKKIEKIGEEIIKGKGRMRDKVMVVNYCLKATVLYRLQYCTWRLDKYVALDKILNKILRKVTKNMHNFPGVLMNAERCHCGLGIRSLSDEANERKLNLITKGIDKEDQTGHALCGLVARGHRVAGKGGAESMEMEIEETLGESVWVTSLVEWISKMRLSFKTCGEKRNPSFAADRTRTKSERIEMNKRGIVMKKEGDEGVDGDEIDLRVGQCWKVGKEIWEIVGFNEEGCEVVKWEGREIKENNRVKISKRKAYEGYPTGMGSSMSASREEICSEGKLVELSKDSVKGKEVSCNIAKIRSRIVCAEKRIVERVEEEGGWRKWRGKTIKNIYTMGREKR